MKKKILLALMALVMGIAVCACGGKEEPEDVVATLEEIPIIESSEEETTEEDVVLEDELPAGMYFSELTNEPIDESLKNQRPIAAMVDNELTALPHFGLVDADIVYEMMNSTKNGRITRFMAIVKDWESIEQLGSIRSVRPTNIMLAAEYNAVLCHDGGPFYIDAYFEKGYMDHFSGLFSRVNNGKSREFTEYILPGDLDKAFNNSGVTTEYNEYYPGTHFNFAPKADPIVFPEDDNSLVANEIKLPFEHNGSYLEYDEESQMYLYSEYGDPHLDGATGEQLKFKNVILQSCTFSQLDDNGYMIFNCIDQGKTGYYITNGRAIRITWTKTSDTDVTRFYDEAGNEITINTGKTYIALVPNDDWSNLLIK